MATNCKILWSFNGGKCFPSLYLFLPFSVHHSVSFFVLYNISFSLSCIFSPYLPISFYLSPCITLSLSLYPNVFSLNIFPSLCLFLLFSYASRCLFFFISFFLPLLYLALQPSLIASFRFLCIVFFLFHSLCSLPIFLSFLCHFLFLYLILSFYVSQPLPSCP
jgi:hypothetical protein